MGRGVKRRRTWAGRRQVGRGREERGNEREDRREEEKVSGTTGREGSKFRERRGLEMRKGSRRLKGGGGGGGEKQDRREARDGRIKEENMEKLDMTTELDRSEERDKRCVKGTREVRRRGGEERGEAEGGRTWKRKVLPGPPGKPG